MLDKINGKQVQNFVMISLILGLLFPILNRHDLYLTKLMASKYKILSLSAAWPAFHMMSLPYPPPPNMFINGCILLPKILPPDILLCMCPWQA